LLGQACFYWLKRKSKGKIYLLQDPSPPSRYCYTTSLCHWGDKAACANQAAVQHEFTFLGRSVLHNKAVHSCRSIVIHCGDDLTVFSNAPYSSKLIPQESCSAVCNSRRAVAGNGDPPKSGNTKSCIIL
jgi:hypothetical protein